MQEELRHEFKQGRFVCELIWKDRRLSAEWSPDVPKKGEVSQEDLAVYVRERQKFLKRIYDTTGFNVAVVDII
jgi:hypothetical protein